MKEVEDRKWVLEAAFSEERCRMQAFRDFDVKF
jgi:hypothetical protein